METKIINPSKKAILYFFFLSMPILAFGQNDNLLAIAHPNTDLDTPKVDSANSIKTIDSTTLVKFIDFNGKLYICPEDNLQPLDWANSKKGNRVTIATSDKNGLENTLLIVRTNGPGDYAAKYCQNLNTYGYDDWYLPSKEELNALYTNRHTIGGFGPYSYWSSTEFGFSNAWYQNFSNGSTDFTFKVTELQVRCVRR